MARVRIKPSKPQSIVGMIAGILFVGLGLAVIIPMFGPFGIIWTLFAVVITVYFAINVFSERGLAHTEIDVERDLETPNDALPFDERLRRLENLRDEKLISEEEYEQKRQEIMRQQW
jgi:hypothetical protein